MGMADQLELKARMEADQRGRRLRLIRQGHAVMRLAWDIAGGGTVEDDQTAHAIYANGLKALELLAPQGLLEEWVAREGRP